MLSAEAVEHVQSDGISPPAPGGGHQGAADEEEGNVEMEHYY